MAPRTPATRKLWATGSVVVCVFAFSGCKGCDEGLLDVDGVKVTGPAEVDPGAPVVYTVNGGIGKKPTKRKCPKTIQMSWVELDARGNRLDVPGASKGKITDIAVSKKQYLYSKGRGCLLRKPGIKIPVNISPGRTDQHKVKLTVSIHGPPPKALPPEGGAPFERLAKIFVLLSLGEETKIVTVKGTPQPVNAPPVAAFITSQRPAKTGAPLGLDARQSTDDVAIVRYDWDLDGNGSYEKTSDSPTGVQVASAKANSQPVRLRVTDNRGEQAVKSDSVPSSLNDVYYDGTPTLSPETTGPGKSVNVSVRRTSPSEAYRADLFCDATLTSAVVTPTEQAFPQPCTFATAGFKTVAVTYSGDPSNPLALKPTTFYRLASIVPGARTSARAAATTPPLSVPLSLSSATLKRLGRLKLGSTSGTIRGLIATGSGRGKVPKQTPRRFRSALRTLASGRFAVKFSGSAKLQSTTINLSGNATMLVRSRRSRKTQICLSVKAAGGGGAARFSVRGATGKARGFAATGTGPPISFDKATGRSATVTLAPRKGRARRLSATCRTLSKVLDGKKLKSKKRKSRSRKR